MKTIFITGASGFIGGSVAAHLAKHGYRVRGLLRNPARTEELLKHGITPVIGSLDDRQLLTSEAQAADIVINAADSDHRFSVEVFLAALSGSGKRFIHTSGTSLVGDEALGEPSNALFNETTPILPAPDKVARIAINDLILAAAPDVHTTVLCNSLIYGTALGPVAQSVQIPPLIAQAKASSIPRHVGRGLNRWSNVHIADVAEIYRLTLEYAPAGSFYFVENGEASFKDIVTTIGEALHLGNAQAWPAPEAITYWGRELAVFGLGSNSRVCADKARIELNWHPQHTSAQVWIKQTLS